MRSIRLLAGLLLLLLPANLARADPASILTVQIENDMLVGTDRYYTSGVRLGWTSPTGAVPDFATWIGRTVWGEGEMRVGVGLSQSMFTPRVTQISPPEPRDRPYAAIVLGDFSLIHDTATARSVLSVGVGMIGPPALGEPAQNNVHHVIGAAPAKGWDFQLPGQPVLQLIAERTWRVPLGQAGPLQFDVLPALTAGVGTWRNYAQAGLQFRLGQGLAADFGAPRIRPGLTGTDAYDAGDGLAWYIFAGADGQAVAWDETLNGLPFRRTAHVSPLPLVGELQVGLAVMALGARFSFTHVFQTQEFRGQYGHMFQFSAASLSVKF